jgi:phosphoribosylglycinamide formyltransferase-1
MPQSLAVAVFASGRGSNLKALHEASISGQLPIKLVGVFSDKAGSGALAYAQAHSIPHAALSAKDFANREQFDLALMRATSAVRPALIVCAGFMRIISEAGILAAPCPMINIHPSLLPKYPGLNTHARALAEGDSEHGASVHLVNAVLDGGRVLSQVKVPVLTNDSVQSLSERVLQFEHPLLIATVRAIAEGRLALADGPNAQVCYWHEDTNTLA